MKTSKTRRARALIVGTLLASVMSVGAVADTASAAKPVKADTNVVIDVGVDIGPVQLQSGIRW